MFKDANSDEDPFPISAVKITVTALLPPTSISYLLHDPLPVRFELRLPVFAWGPDIRMLESLAPLFFSAKGIVVIDAE